MMIMIVKMDMKLVSYDIVSGPSSFYSLLQFLSIFFLERCSYTCAKSHLRCILDANHEGKRHKFTPDHLLSPSTITKIVLELTSGKIKSRAGLDNIDVVKGHENFENMRAMVDNLTSIIGGNNAAQTGAKLKEKIAAAEERLPIHEASGKHCFPQSNLESRIHELHMSGKFAFSLATGT